ncbi:MAG: DUF1800 domain-containing protein, partial [Synechococcaceae cyanobacterium SM2_3_1]|nr:DUF1800 domain-containing protein [Synechococcaceae cyanobacterium SM2_3_1]
THPPLPPQFEPLGWTPRQLRQADPAQRRQLIREVQARGVELGSWIVKQIVTSPNPLLERISSFWRDHFVVSVQSFNLIPLIADYEQRLRLHALGNFQELLWSVTTSPAMLLYLNNQQNQGGQINENYSRELMELFTIGRGAYTESDVQEGARALTGWTIQPGELFLRGHVASRFVPRRHDSGAKTFLGYEGNLKAEDVVEILAQHPDTARQISTQLWSELAYPDPEPEVIQDLAAVFTQSQQDIAVLVAAIFEHPQFYSVQAYRSRIKSPQYFLVGAIRQLQLSADYPQALQHLQAMGQPLYRAPSVKGWPQQEGWLDSVALLTRLDLAEQLTRGDSDVGGYRFDPDPYSSSDLAMLLLDGDLPAPLQASPLGSLEDTAALLLASPTYQLA